MSAAVARVAAAVWLAAWAPWASAGEGNRKELQRADLSGAPGMEVVLSVSEYKPGEELPLHIHHGIEAAYVIEGAMVEAPGRAPFALPTGASVMNLRDVAHAGWKVVGDRTLRIVTVHVVDKGKPLYDWVGKAR